MFDKPWRGYALFGTVPLRRRPVTSALGTVPLRPGPVTSAFGTVPFPSRTSDQCFRNCSGFPSANAPCFRNCSGISIRQSALPSELFLYSHLANPLCLRNRSSFPSANPLCFRNRSVLPSEPVRCCHSELLLFFHMLLPFALGTVPVFHLSNLSSSLRYLFRLHI